MSILVELTYEMGKALGDEFKLEVYASDVPAVVEATRKRFDSCDAADFERLRSRAAIAVNGVLVRHRDEGATSLHDGDRVSFVKAAAGG